MRHQLKPKSPSARARMSYILRSDRYGVNPSRAAELVAAGVANLPAWADGPAEFWSAVDGFERANGRLCLELELNLPRELSREGQVAAVADYIDRLTAAAGAFPITWAIHDSDDGNPHVHLMLQERALDGRARGPREHFKRANSKNPEQGGVVKSRWWHKRENVFWSRALWADACNQQLLAAGQAPRFDARRKSVRLDEALRAGDLRAAAALCTQTERHEGVKVAAARRKLEGGWIEADDLPEQVMQIISANDCARGYNGWLRDWSRTATDKELRLFLADHLHDLHQTLEREMQGGHIEARAAWLEQQHAEALAEDAERTAELAELVAGEQMELAEDRGALAAVQAAHAEALAEDDRLVARRAEIFEQIRGEMRAGRAAGWLHQDEVPGLVEQVRSCGYRLDELGDLRADLGDRRARWDWEQQKQVRPEGPSERVSLVEQFNAGLAGLQQPAPDLDDPATLIHHDDDPQWIEFEGQDGDVLGCWSDDPDTQWRYDSDTSDWVECDPDHRPSSGPRLG